MESDPSQFSCTSCGLSSSGENKNQALVAKPLGKFSVRFKGVSKTSSFAVDSNLEQHPTTASPSDSISGMASLLAASVVPTPAPSTYGGGFVRLSALPPQAAIRPSSTSLTASRHAFTSDDSACLSENMPVSSLALDGRMESWTDVLRKTQTGAKKSSSTNVRRTTRGTTSSRGSRQPVKREGKSGRGKGLELTPDGLLYDYRWYTVGGRRVFVYNNMKYKGRAAHKLWAEVQKIKEKNSSNAVVSASDRRSTSTASSRVTSNTRRLTLPSTVVLPTPLSAPYRASDRSLSLVQKSNLESALCVSELVPSCEEMATVVGHTSRTQATPTTRRKKASHGIESEKPSKVIPVEIVSSSSDEDEKPSKYWEKSGTVASQLFYGNVEAPSTSFFSLPSETLEVAKVHSVPVAKPLRTTVKLLLDDEPMDSVKSETFSPLPSSVSGPRRIELRSQVLEAQKGGVMFVGVPSNVTGEWKESMPHSSPYAATSMGWGKGSSDISLASLTSGGFGCAPVGYSAVENAYEECKSTNALDGMDLDDMLTTGEGIGGFTFR